MKNFAFHEKFCILFINVILFILLFLLIDFCIYKVNLKYCDYNPKPKYFDYIDNIKYHIIYKEEIENRFTGENNIDSGRLPDGLEYKNKKPIVIFGCSFAFGQHLNSTQTFSYKLAHILKRPVYNRALSGTGFQHMYMQTVSDYFYKDVPNSDTFIYIMIDDHYRRMLGRTFCIVDDYFYPYFHYKNGKLIYENYNNKVLNFFRSLYISKFIKSKLDKSYLENPKNAEALTDFALAYFVESRKALENNLGHKINFYIVFYESSYTIRYKELLIQKLKKNNFKVIETSKLTNEVLYLPKYISDKLGHPSEVAWDLLTPLIAKELIK